MEGRLLLKDCSFVDSEGRRHHGASILVENDQMTQVADIHALPGLPGDWEVACRGRWVVPGFVDAYALPVEGVLSAQPMKAGTRPLTDAQLQSLTSPEWTAILLAQMARFAVAGVSFSVQHLRLPGRTFESLNALRQAAELVGLRVYAGASDESESGLAQTAQFIRELQGQGTVRGAWGVDDSQALTPSQWELRIERAQASGTGMLVLDGALSPARKAQLPRGSVIAADGAESPDGHGIVYARRPGASPSAAVDAIASLGETTFAHACALAQRGVQSALDPSVLFNPQGLHTHLFGGAAGQIAPGHAADLVVLDDVPADDATLAWRRLPQMRVAWHIVAGKVLVREGQLLTAPLLDVLRDEQQAIQAWRKRSAAAT